MRTGIFPIPNGWWVLIDKPPGWTSFDVVARVRKITGEKKVGHVGTLDPFATGLLVLAVGSATKCLGEYLIGNKKYQATIQLGAGSPSDDPGSKLQIRLQCPEFTKERILQGLMKIAKAGMQKPPMVSALKRYGRPFYQLARKGWWLERENRPASINRLECFEYDPLEGTVQLEVECGRGVYIRSIAHDLGEWLGIPALLSSLRRTVVGNYRIEDAISLNTLAETWNKIS